VEDKTSADKTPPAEPEAEHIEPAPLPTAPSVVPVAESAKPTLRKEVREWAAFGTSLLALAVSVASYFNSQSSSKLAQTQFDSDRAIVLVGEKMKDEKPEGMLFKFHALQSSQRVSRLQITVPTAFDSKSWTATPPDQVLSLVPIDYKIGDYYLKTVGRKEGFAGVVRGEIPVVLDAIYSVSGESMQRRGLYSLEVLVVIGEKDTELPSVDIKDFAFIQALGMDSDPQKVVDDVWNQREQRVHDK
jgi:hypothetical protein